MDSMDIDIDLDEEIDPEIQRLRAEADAINKRADDAKADEKNGVEEVAEEGEVDENAPAPYKVHVRGLDDLNTNQISDWIKECGAWDSFEKVQWVNDTSANLIYDNEDAAADALRALSAEEILNPLQLRSAHRLSIAPRAQLVVRQALQGDVKVRNAKDHSRYYLHHPEWEPETRNKRKRVYDDANRNKYRRRDYEDDQSQRRGSMGATFHEDMYGEDTGASDPSWRPSDTSNHDYRRRRVTHDNGDVFAKRQNERLRNRSVSPGRDGNGKYGFSDEQPRRQTARPRAATPVRDRVVRRDRGARDGASKELFPDRKGSSALDVAYIDGPESQPGRPSPSSKELFPDKAHSPNHQRKNARDLRLRQATDAIGRPTDNLGGAKDSGKKKSDLFSRTANGGGSKGDLFSRVSGANSESSYGRLNASAPHDSGVGNTESSHQPLQAQSNGFNFLGAGDKATNGDGAGFRIKGASNTSDSEYSFLGAGARPEREDRNVPKELFPRRSDGADGGGRDLFANGTRGAGGNRRRRAEDLI